MERPLLNQIVPYGQSLGYAMQITTEEEAKSYFGELVKYYLRFGKPDVQTKEDAIRQVKMSLGYYAGYYDADTANRVFKLFEAVHPVFGKAA